MTASYESYEWLTAYLARIAPSADEAHIKPFEARYGMDFTPADVIPLRLINQVARARMTPGADYTALNRIALERFGITDIQATYDQLRARQLDFLSNSPAAISEANFANMGGNVGRIGMADPDPYIPPGSKPPAALLAAAAALLLLGGRK